MGWYKEAQTGDRVKYDARLNLTIVVPDSGSDNNNYDQAYNVFMEYLREMEQLPKPADPQTGIDISMRIMNPIGERI